MRFSSYFPATGLKNPDGPRPRYRTPGFLVSSSGHAGPGLTGLDGALTRTRRPWTPRIGPVVRTRKPKTEIVVAVAGVVVVAVRRATVPGGVVPATAPDHPVAARVPSDQHWRVVEQPLAEAPGIDPPQVGVDARHRGGEGRKFQPARLVDSFPCP